MLNVNYYLATIFLRYKDTLQSPCRYLLVLSYKNTYIVRHSKFAFTRIDCVVILLVLILE